MLGRVLCAIGRHAWERRVNREVSGADAVYFVCRRCGTEKPRYGPPKGQRMGLGWRDSGLPRAGSSVPLSGSGLQIAICGSLDAQMDGSVSIGRWCWRAGGRCRSRGTPRVAVGRLLSLRG
jgi:hypothetical protein